MEEKKEVIESDKQSSDIKEANQEVPEVSKDKKKKKVESERPPGKSIEEIKNKALATISSLPVILYEEKIKILKNMSVKEKAGVDTPESLLEEIRSIEDNIAKIGEMYIEAYRDYSYLSSVYNYLLDVGIRCSLESSDLKRKGDAKLNIEDVFYRLLPSKSLLKTIVFTNKTLEIKWAIVSRRIAVFEAVAKGGLNWKTPIVSTNWLKNLPEQERDEEENQEVGFNDEDRESNY